MSNANNSLRPPKEAETVNFIELVKKYPCLYDDEIKKKTNPRDIIANWQEISNICRTDVAKVKRKWNYLVDQFKKKSNPINMSKSTNNTDKSKDFKYQDELNFLNDCQEIVIDEIVAVNKQKQVTKTEPPGSDEDDLSSISSSRKRPRSSLDDTLPSTSSGYQSAVYQDNRSNTSVHNDNAKDPLTSFFDSACASTKLLPRDLQIDVKAKVGEIICAAERTANTRDPN